MLYFIPAWYQDNLWCENEQVWYTRRMHTEFDDTVKQIQLFHRNGTYPYQILLLSFAPNLRHFLHRQGVYHAAYWSCFDAIQEVRRKKVRLLSYHNLNWPEHTEFMYTPFAIVAWVNGVKYAQIEFAEDGNPIQIDMYREEQLVRRNIYDDRGFVSSTLIYEAGQLLYQDYLTEHGVWKIRVYNADGHVEVNPNTDTYLISYGEKEIVHKFSKEWYQSLEEVIGEVFGSYIACTQAEDIFCAAMHRLHTTVLMESLKGRKIIPSFFENRYPLYEQQNALEFLAVADYMITDSKENSEKIEAFLGRKCSNLTDMTPYDTRQDFGISQQISVQKIMVPVDGIEESLFADLIGLLAEYLKQNENAMIHLFTRQADDQRKSKLLAKTADILQKAGYEPQLAAEEETLHTDEDMVDEEGEIKPRFTVEQCIDELEVSRCIREQRIIVDVRFASDLYLQISGISVGIPQIIRMQTQYVQHGKNGYVLEDLCKLPEILAFYLESLSNWNEAMIWAAEIGKRFTTEQLMEQWEEVIEAIG